MNLNLPHSPRWSTASFGDSAHASSVDLLALGEHFNRCKGANNRWHALRCLAEIAHGFIAARFVTSLVVVTLLIGFSTLVA